MRTTEQYTFFFSERDVFSNWHIAPFVYKGVTFNCNEQFMMYCKAKLFGDDIVAQKILNEPNQKKQKALGRQVKGLKGGQWDADDVALWNSKCKKFVGIGAKHKFLQHPQLFDQLMATDGTTLVEASPYDGVWGIKMGQYEDGVEDPNNWKGSNWLGEILTQLREHFKANPHMHPTGAHAPSFAQKL